jgi:hypothetical protein
MGFSVLAQAISIGAMLYVVKTNYVNEAGKLTPTGETGAKTTLAICQNVAGVVMFLGTMALNMVVRKFLHVEPLSAVTVNHESQAFIGVRGSLTGPGTGGLELSRNNFKLSAGYANREFDASGHEIIGFKTEADTKIVGNQDLLTLQSPQLKLVASQSSSSVLFNNEKMHAYVGGSEVAPETSLQMGEIQLTSPRGGAASKQKGIRLGISTAGTAVSMSENWIRLSCDDGTMLEIEKNSQAKLSYGNSSASVLLTQTEASLNFGIQTVKLGSTGVDIAGVIKILAPAVGIFDVQGKMTVSSEILAVIADGMKDQVESIAKEKTSAAINRMNRHVSNIKRGLETKISAALTKSGAV